MPSMTIELDGDGILKNFTGEVVHITTPFTITTLAGGMDSGLPSVAIILDLPDGRKVLAETSARLLLGAAEAIRIRYRKELGE